VTRPLPNEDPARRDRGRGSTDRPDATDSPSQRYPGDEVLGGESPAEVLERLVDGDPLHVEDRCRLRLRQKDYLLPLERLVDRAMARAAYAAVEYAGEPPLGEWLSKCIERAERDLLDEQYDEEVRRVPPSLSADRSFYEELAKSTKIELALCRSLCLAVNSLDSEHRSVLCAVTLHGKSLRRYVAEGNGPPARVSQLLREALVDVLATLSIHPSDYGKR